MYNIQLFFLHNQFRTDNPAIVDFMMTVINYNKRKIEINSK